MGLFDWFRSRPSNLTVLPDAIWMTKNAKFDGITQALAKRLQAKDQSDALILVAHFRDTLDELQQCAEKAGVSGSVLIVSSENLDRIPACNASFDDSQLIQFLVAEYHPLPSHDEAVMKFAENLPCRCRIVHHASFEDPLVRVVCQEWTENLLKRLGIKDDEVIESVMIGRRIRAASKKFATEYLKDSRLTELPADSAEMWLERNCSSNWPKLRG